MPESPGQGRFVDELGQGCVYLQARKGYSATHSLILMNRNEPVFLMLIETGLLNRPVGAKELS